MCALDEQTMGKAVIKGFIENLRLPRRGIVEEAAEAS